MRSEERMERNSEIENAKSPFWSQQTHRLITLGNNTLRELGLARLGLALHLLRHGIQDRIHHSHHGEHATENGAQRGAQLEEGEVGLANDRSERRKLVDEVQTGHERGAALQRPDVVRLRHPSDQPRIGNKTGRCW